MEDLQHLEAMLRLGLGGGIVDVPGGGVLARFPFQFAPGHAVANPVDAG